jgi:hypothetical protein
MQYEYKLLKRENYSSDEAFFKVINKLAENGWRLLEGTYRSSRLVPTTVIMESAYHRYVESD